MTFTIRTSTNPHTRGKGACFTVATAGPAQRFDPDLSVMFDEYDIKPAATAVIRSPRLVDATDHDEGCSLRFVNDGAEITLVLVGSSLQALENQLAILRDHRADDVSPGTGPSHVIR